ncbi:MAG: amidohydrolase [Chloroflexi bacterium]|nr:amidohydrolase [Chloroflexota bacterium]
MTATLREPATTGAVTPTLVDGDIHTTFASGDELLKYLPRAWRRQQEMFGGWGFSGTNYPKDSPNAARVDSWPPAGGPPGSSLPFLREQLLDEWGIDVAINNPLFHSGRQRNPGYAAALATAVNEWQLGEWSGPEPRIKASICVAQEDGDAAAAEIERRASDPTFIQVLLVIRTSEPLGRRKYWKLYEAAARNNLPIGIHFGGHGGHPITGTGWPSYYLEDHTGMSQSFQGQLISLIYEGVFEQFPTLRICLIEGGFAWLPTLAWRMDAAWKKLRDEVPHLKRRPSEYIRDHIWLTTQPMEEPHTPEHFAQILRHGNLVDRLIFATDYPHWDFDAPNGSLPKTRLPDEFEQRLFYRNAIEFYGARLYPRASN